MFNPWKTVKCRFIVLLHCSLQLHIFCIMENLFLNSFYFILFSVFATCSLLKRRIRVSLPCPSSEPGLCLVMERLQTSVPWESETDKKNLSVQECAFLLLLVLVLVRMLLLKPNIVAVVFVLQCWAMRMWWRRVRRQTRMTGCWSLKTTASLTEEEEGKMKKQAARLVYPLWRRHPGLPTPCCRTGTRRAQRAGRDCRTTTAVGDS